jgi:hypothetical protein
MPIDLLRSGKAPVLAKQGPHLGYSFGDWKFNVDTDGRNYELSDKQCDAAFPDYYKEIERAVAWRKEQNLTNIEESQMDISWGGSEIIRLMIYDRQVSFGLYYRRHRRH